MRIRRAVTATAVTLLLAACGGQSQPADHGPSTDPPPPEALQTKLEAQIQDPCFQDPDALTPTACRKYVTQISNTANAVREVGTNDPALRDAAQTIDKGIKKYRSNGCAGTKEEKPQCTAALSTAADGLRSAHDTLATANN